MSIVEVSLNIKRLILTISVLIMLAGCVKTNIPPLPLSVLEDNISQTDNGEYILLTAPQQVNTFKIGDSIGVVIQNTSDYKFTYNYNDVKLFFLDENNTWREIKNTAVFMGNGETEVGEIGSVQPPSTILETFDTDIFYNKTTYLKILISGELSKENTEIFSTIKIAVAIDVQLAP